MDPLFEDRCIELTELLELNVDTNEEHALVVGMLKLIASSSHNEGGSDNGGSKFDPGMIGDEMDGKLEDIM